MRVELTFSSKEAEVALDRLATANFERPMQAASGILVGSVQTNFSVGGRFDRAGSIMGGTNKWLVTSNPKPLIRQGMNGGLMGSIQPAWDRTSAWVTTNKPYAAAHNFGHVYGARSSLLNRRVNNGFTLPARPFMVIQDEDVEDIIDLLRGFLLGAAAR